MTALFEMDAPAGSPSCKQSLQVAGAERTATAKKYVTVADLHLNMMVDAELGRSRVIALYRVTRRFSGKPAMRVEFEIDGHEYTRLLNLDDVLSTPADAAFRRWLEFKS